MSEPLIEKMMNRSTMLLAQQELIAMGESAIPLLESVFNGSAVNQFGVPYKNLGSPVTNAIEVCSRLGTIAKRLEPYLREQLETGSEAAARALGCIGSLESESVIALAHCLEGDIFVASEAAVSLIKNGYSKHKAVCDILNKSDKALKIYTKFKSNE